MIMNNLIKDLLIGLQPEHLVTMILLILLAGCDYHSMPSDVRKSLDLAYQAYSKIPEHLKYNQEIFMRFVLPYRNLNEPVEVGLRRYFFTRYHWVFDRMHQYGSLQQAACDLLDSLNISFHHLYRYPFMLKKNYSDKFK